MNRIDEGVFQQKLPIGQTVTDKDIIFLQSITKKVYVDSSVKNYIVSITNATRNPSQFIAPELARYVQFGASPRGSIALQQVARALALMQGRSHVTPDDVKALRYSVLRHRIILNFEAVADKVHSETIIDAVFSAISTP